MLKSITVFCGSSDDCPEAYKEAAERLGVSEGTVKSRVNRAKSKLKEWLAEERELSPGKYVQRNERQRGGDRS